MSARPPLESMLTRSWLQRGALSWLLLPLALLYRLVSRMHRGWYACGLGTRQAATVPVVVVGNVVAGGAGKTPVVMALVEHFKQLGWSVGIVSRGYGRRHGEASMVHAAMSADDVGDEPLLLAQRCHVPVAVARRRMEAVQLLLRTHPRTQLIVSDDGLQHHAMQHDVALCVFDERGTGNGWPLPAGPLREAWPRQPWPGSVQLVAHTGGGSPPDGFRITRQLASHAFNGHGETRALTDWRTQPVAAIAGIAHPARFFFLLQQQGVNVVTTLPLPDHADREQLVRALSDVPPGHAVLCTEKDAVKLWPSHPEVWAVALHTELPPDLLARIDEVLAAKLSLPHGQQTA